jgi:hypothetical protein
MSSNVGPQSTKKGEKRPHLAASEINLLRNLWARKEKSEFCQINYFFSVGTMLAALATKLAIPSLLEVSE